jgi:ornithine--oxo-acid transaminase
VPAHQATILVATNNFHGRTSTIVSFSTDSSSRAGFGPYMPGFYVVPYNDLASVEEAMQERPNIVGFMVEPMQGEAGVIVPDEGYYRGIRALCDRYNVLWMDDEIQTGLGRTGKMLAVDYESVRPDVLILGKALSGGTMPVSAILADDEVMLTIRPGEHGSTFGGNPLAARVAITALDIIKDEGLAENAYRLGFQFRERMRAIDSKAIRHVRGKGLLNAVVIEERYANTNAYGICKRLASAGLLAKQTHGNIIRFAPPLVITEEQLAEGCDIIESTIKASEA